MKKFLIGVFAAALIISSHAFAQTISPDAGNTSTFFAARLDASSSGIIVKELQQLLQQKGFFNGPTNGKYGPLTIAAVKQFQSANGLKPVGTVGPQTRALLNAQTNPQVSENIAIANPVPITSGNQSNGTAVCTSTSMPSITLLSPNSGTYQAGVPMQLTWSTCNIPTMNRIDVTLYVPTTGVHYYLTAPLNGSTSPIVYNTGSTTLTIPSTVSAGSYSVTISSDVGGVTRIDYSDGVITIPARSGSCMINSFTANPTTINSGQSSILAWSTTGCVMTTINAMDHSWIDGHKFTPNDSMNTGPLQGTVSYTAVATSQAGCSGTNMYSTVDGQVCVYTAKAVTVTVNSSTSLDPTPRIAYWSGKVNQHIDANGNWTTDPDGSSGASVMQLTYCKKWYPNTVSVAAYKSETITDWKDAGNKNNYTMAEMSYKCVQGSGQLLDKTPRIAYWYGKVNQHVDASGIWVTDIDGSSGATIDKLTYCKKWYPSTTSVASYKTETITDWKDGGNRNNYTMAETSYQCKK